MSSGRRFRDLALLLPVAGLLLFMPPYLRIMSRADQLFGIPVLHVYIFALWFAGIVLTAVISRRLVRELALGAAETPPRTEERDAGPS